MASASSHEVSGVSLPYMVAIDHLIWPHCAWSSHVVFNDCPPCCIHAQNAWMECFAIYIYHSIKLPASHSDYACPSCFVVAPKAKAGGETISQTTHVEKLNRLTHTQELVNQQKPRYIASSASRAIYMLLELKTKLLLMPSWSLRTDSLFVWLTKLKVIVSILCQLWVWLNMTSLIDGQYGV